MKRRIKGLTEKEVMDMRDAARQLQKELLGASVIGANAGFGSCQVCGAKNEELRPYGPNGESICYNCGQKNKAETEKQIGKYLFGDK